MPFFFFFWWFKTKSLLPSNCLWVELHIGQLREGRKATHILACTSFAPRGTQACMCCHSFSIATKPGVLGCPPITGDRAMPPFPSHISWLHDCPSSRAEFRASEKSVIEYSVNLRVCIGWAGWLVRNSIMECSFGGTLPHCILVAVNTIRQGGSGVTKPESPYLCLVGGPDTHICAAPSGLHVLFVKRFVTAAGNVTVWRTKARSLPGPRCFTLLVSTWQDGENMDNKIRGCVFGQGPVTVFGATSVSQDHRVRKYFFQRERHFPGVKSRELHTGGSCQVLRNSARMHTQ